MSVELNSRHVFTRSIAAASSLLAIGAKLRPMMPVTVVEDRGSKDTLFWFEPEAIEVAGVRLATGQWLGLLLCPWPEFMACKELGAAPLDHPVAFLKASAENRSVLVAGVKTASGKPFRVIRRGSRTIVIGADVSEENQRRILQRG
jgi:hypothetical protein